MKSLSEIGNYVIHYLLTTGPSVLMAIATLFIGLYIIRKVTRFIENRILKRNIEASLAYFLSSFLRFILVGLLLITVASMLGIATSSFVAVLGAAGLAVGLALQGSLSNFAGGMIILFFKPFKVGEYITTDGKEGTVEQIDILNTTLCTGNNQILIIPNGPLANSTIVNHTRKDCRRISIVVGISYHSNINDVRDLLVHALENEEMVMKDPAPFVIVKSFGDNSVNLGICCWCHTKDYWTLDNTIHEIVKDVFDHHHIELPFPQRIVHLLQENCTTNKEEPHRHSPEYF